MNNQEKYLAIGIIGALMIVFVLKSILCHGFNTNFLITVILAISGIMIYLVLSIFYTTQKLAPTKTRLHRDEQN